MAARTIIVAADEVDGNQLEAALRSDGCRIKNAGDAEEVLTAVAEGNGDISVVVLDLMKPGEDGLETLRGIRRLKPRLPIIALSAVSSPARVVAAMRSGASDFLPKPVAPDDLLQAVRNATRNGVEPARELIPAPRRPEIFFTGNPRMRAIQSALGQVAASDVPVVLRGESGVGKEVLAREIHAQSARATKPFLKINCAALPLELLESELFGYERGAFTGAMKTTPGKFEIADGGTILLDEIGDMDIKLQAKLLHVLQDGEFARLGGRETIRVDVRVIAATHCDLENGIQEKWFREDLYYRLNVISIDLPPLRERKDEILPLAAYFMRKHASPDQRVPVITPALQEAILAYSWPGNIRELENVIRKLLVFGDPDEMAHELRIRTGRFGPTRETLVPPLGEQPSVLDQMNEARRVEEAQTIIQALNRAHWNRKRAAASLNVDYKGLLYKMKKLGIGPCQPAAAALPSNVRHRPSYLERR